MLVEGKVVDDGFFGIDGEMVDDSFFGSDSR